MSKRKLHLLAASGRGIDDEWYASAFCGRYEDSNHEWEGTQKHELVTCKSCLKRFTLRNQTRYWSADYISQNKQRFLWIR